MPENLLLLADKAGLGITISRSCPYWRGNLNESRSSATMLGADWRHCSPLPSSGNCRWVALATVSDKEGDDEEKADAQLS
jgi:hypothetical protein